jgi:hypothetical protein
MFPRMKIAPVANVALVAAIFVIPLILAAGFLTDR